MMNLIVAMDHVSMVHGHVMAMVTVQTALMKLTVAVTKAVQMVNLNVLMADVSMVHGHVTDMVTVQTAQMKLTVVSLMTHVLMTIVKMARTGMATLAILVIIV